MTTTLPINTIIQGDCLEVMADWPDGAVDLVLTDPPYGIGLSSHGQITMTRKPVIGDENQDVGRKVLLWCEKAGLPTIAFSSPKKPWPGQWRQHLVWNKGGAVGGGGDLGTCWKFSWETIQVARTGTLNGCRQEAVLRYPVSQRDFHWHPNQKPVGLLTYLIWKTGAQVILDPFCGSGSTCVAAKMLGRDYIGIDISSEYVAIARERLRAVDTGVPVAEARNGQQGLFESL